VAYGISTGMLSGYESPCKVIDQTYHRSLA
jgi:hypothetical protein